jgi:putative transposase
MADALWSGRRFRSISVNDDFNRDSLRIAIDTSLPFLRVIQSLDENGWSYAPAPRQRSGVH